ncbi:hypothetical protein BCU09_16850 [Vibrio cyclitrophicus]|uniref:glycosyltransferase n=1 Tax=Vibrio cyclitrophicus TaxID=47951 RepID=UPI000C844563|nr:glycosyltransferase [Vibrio cyclitrophicus]PMK00913.1 hypothetical protein BCU09_16850 [Vibrio cyclitrophicus]
MIKTIDKIGNQVREEKIKGAWMNTDEVLVSIVCATYNQEAYISDALDGFLSQVTDFRFEIIIHDDASTDNTSQIIRRYKKEYPSIITVIIQEENQYSKGAFRPLVYASKYAKGHYIAICEGDDYWIDSNKLSKQVSLIKKNNNTGLVISDYNVKVEQENRYIFNCVKKNKVEVLSKLNFESFLVNMGYFAPMTWLLPLELWKEATDVNEVCHDGTFVWFLYILKNSKVLILDDTTSVYRHLTESATKSSDVDKLLKRNKSLLETQLRFHNYYDLNESLIDDIYAVHYNQNLDAITSKKLSMSNVKMLINDFKWSFFVKMNKRQRVQLLSLFFPVPFCVKKGLFKIITKTGS